MEGWGKGERNPCPESSVVIRGRFYLILWRPQFFDCVVDCLFVGLMSVGLSFLRLACTRDRVLLSPPSAFGNHLSLQGHEDGEKFG